MLPLLLAVLLLSPALFAQRRVALTFDDLPNAGASRAPGDILAMTHKLLDALVAEQAPAVGFVNEIQLETDREARTAALRLWVDRGVTLGNHTYSHPDINNTSMLVYQEDILRGEHVTAELMKAEKQKLVWFRHPFTHTGPDEQTKSNLDSFLKRKGYRVAPFTIENSDYMFHAVYLSALAKDNTALAEKVRAAYLDYTDTQFDFFEKLAKEFLGRDLPQILLLHANQLNADVMKDMLARIKKRGYRFVSLEEAMSDDAYGRQDSYVGRNGPSWLHRWMISSSKPNRMREEPDPPAWVTQYFRGLQP